MPNLARQFRRRARITGCFVLLIFCFAIPAEAATKKQTGPRALPIGKIRALPRAQLIQAEGIVTSLPHALGKNIFYLADATGGIQALVVRGEPPHLKEGDRVRLIGKTSLAGEEYHIRIARPEDIRRTTTEKAITPKIIPLDALAQSDGTLVQLAGIIAEKRGQTIVLEDGSSTARILLKRSAPFSKQVLVKGQRLTVAGIVSHAPDGYRLLPRSDADLIAEEAAPRRKSAARSPAPRAQSLGERALTVFLALLGIAAAVGLQRFGGKQEHS